MMATKIVDTPNGPREYGGDATPDYHRMHVEDHRKLAAIHEAESKSRSGGDRLSHKTAAGRHQFAADVHQTALNVGPRKRTKMQDEAHAATRAAVSATRQTPGGTDLINNWKGVNFSGRYYDGGQIKYAGDQS